MHKLRILVTLFFLSFAASLSHAQSALLDLPRQSQHALVAQRIGVTDITISYHRPLVNGRQVWGNLVPYGQVWRAGANENTTISFSDPVTVEGKLLDKGTYGLHMIPGEDQWTIICSKMATAWGSFSYDQTEDALRVTVKPQAAEFREALAYDFDNVKPDSAVATLRWEKVAVPFKIGVNLNEAVVNSLHKQLRGIAQYTWDGWDDAATYLVDNKMDLEEALKYEDNSIQSEERFENLMTKSRILDALGRKAEAATTREKGLAKGSSTQLYGYARQLQTTNHQDEAFALFRAGANKFPNDWLSHLGSARVDSAQGNFAEAAKEMKASIAGAPDSQKQRLEGFLKRLEAKEDINK